MSAGFWRSADLHSWEFFPIRSVPIYDYAPDVRVLGDYLYFCASKLGKKCPIYRTQNPEADDFHEVSRPLTFWDPNLFQDDDGRTYLYWGCSNKTPIWGIEMDSESMQPIATPGSSGGSLLISLADGPGSGEGIFDGPTGITCPGRERPGDRGPSSTGSVGR